MSMRYVGETLEQYQQRTGRANFETAAEQRVRMQEECRSYARANNPPRVVRTVPNHWATCRVRKSGLVWVAYVEQESDAGMGLEYGPFPAFTKKRAIKKAQRYARRRNREDELEVRVRVA